MELTKLSGIGESRKKAFEELGIFSQEDLLNFLPYKYYDFSKTEPFADDGKVRLIKAQATEVPKIVSIKKNFSFVSCKMTDETGHIFTAVWYNQTYIKAQIFLGVELYLFGKNSKTKKNNFVVLISKFQDKLSKLALLPIYKTAGKIGQTIIQNSINQVLKTLNIWEFIPHNMLQKYNLIDIKSAYQILHSPNSFEELEKASERLEIENLIPHIAISEYHKSIFRTIKLQKYNNFVQIFENYKNLLPFSLTSDQTEAIFDLEKDMNSKFSMNRLLQGDVGSGKTAVAFFGAYFAQNNGHQSAIIAPTEILANQHYKTAQKLFDNNQIALLTSSICTQERKNILNRLKLGEIKIIIGTHSLLSDEIQFNDLTYLVIDEQHRFGVEQRKKLKNKGFSPDILVMSATPIPRSLSLVLYGDLDISTLYSRPKASKTTTNLVSEAKINDMWNYIAEKIKTGSKAYVVCSKIDEELDDDQTLEFSAKNLFNKLSEKFGENIGLLHGKLSKNNQNQIIGDFSSGKLKILVSTTVVEVGVDIPDADIIVIASPERFGLATLHQLRGRVGRNGQEAHCFCLTSNLNQKSYERLLFFKNNSDGFKIAEFDLKTRGSGTIIGTNQHGKEEGISFSASNYSTAKQILEQIKKDISLYAKVLERGEKLYNQSVISKIVLN